MVLADVLVAPAMQAFVLDDELLRREVHAEPDITAARPEIELRAGRRRLAKADIALAMVAHRAMRNMVLHDLQIGPAGHRRTPDCRAGAKRRDA